MSTTFKANKKSIHDACKATLSDGTIASRYTLKLKRVCWIKSEKDGSKTHVPICDPFEVLGRTYDEVGEKSGLVVRFVADRAKQSIVVITVPMAELISEPKKVVASMADKGLWIAGNRDSVAKLSELLSSIRPENDIVTASRPGWYDETFVSPSGEVFGDCDEPHRLSESVRFADPEKSGNLKGWCKATSAALESANGDFLCIGLLSGFVGPLLNLMQESTSVLINFAGTTSRGKTTAQRLGASVWGNPKRGAALSKFNVTPNAIEAIAERANGSLLAIDEGGQSGMSGSQYQTAVFNLAEGSGKHRLTAAATERKVRRWSTCITISEEIGFADKVKRDGRNPAAGAVARIWEVDVDDAEILSDEVVAQIEGVKANFGHAAPVFIQHLIDFGYAKDADTLRQRTRETEAMLSNGQTSPQHRRVAGAAAMLLIAGETAQDAGLIDKSFDLAGAVGRALERSFVRMARDMDPIETALANLRSRVLFNVGNTVLELDHDRENLHREVEVYFGYPDGPSRFTSNPKDRHDSERVYMIPVDHLMKLCGGNVTAAAIARALNKKGYLLTPSAKNSKWTTLPRGEKIEHYRVSGAFFHDNEVVMLEEVA